MIEDPVTLAWASGVCDGESYFGANTWGGSTRITFEVDQATRAEDAPEMLRRLQIAFGFGSIRRKLQPGPTGKIIWRYSVSNAPDVHAIVRAIWPLLGRVKRRQAVRALRKHRKARRRLPVTR